MRLTVGHKRSKIITLFLGANFVFIFILRVSQTIEIDTGRTNLRQPHRSAPSSTAIITAKYFRVSQGKFCSFLNSHIPKSLVYKTCICLDGFFGHDCGIPGFIWTHLLANGTRMMRLQRLRFPRKILEYKYGRLNILKGQTKCAGSQSTGRNISSAAQLDLKQRRETPDLEVYTGPEQSNFTCNTVQAFSCDNMACCWNQYWTRASELSFTDFVIVGIRQKHSAVSSLPGEVLEFLKFYEGFPEVLMIRRGPSVTVVATFKAIAIECNFDVRCIASCGNSKFQLISLDV